MATKRKQPTASRVGYYKDLYWSTERKLRDAKFALAAKDRLLLIRLIANWVLFILASLFLGILVSGI